MGSSPQAQHAEDHLGAAGERPGHGARPGHAGVGRDLGRARQRQRRSRSERQQGRIKVPPDEPACMLRRVWLSRKTKKATTTAAPTVRSGRSATLPTRGPSSTTAIGPPTPASTAAADTVLQEIAPGPAIVFVQDYHFALLPRFIKDARPDVIVCQFWHIPWPNPEAFQVCPWGEQILHGLLGNDLLSFHIQQRNNFLETVERTLESRVDYERFAVVRGGHPTMVRPHPISIDPELWAGPTRPPIVRPSRGGSDARWASAASV